MRAGLGGNYDCDSINQGMNRQSERGGNADVRPKAGVGLVARVEMRCEYMLGQVNEQETDYNPDSRRM